MDAVAMLVLAVSLAAPGGGTLVRNGGFELDADRDGVPDGWHAAGDRTLVTQTLGFDAGRTGGRSARLTCTRFQAGSPAAHAMLAQMGVPVRRGTGYRVTLWARAEDLRADIVSIALSDTGVWRPCGLDGAFAPGREWRRFVKKLPVTNGLRRYLFAGGRRSFAVVWKAGGTGESPLTVGDPRLHARDLMGRELPRGKITAGETPLYVLGEGVSAAELEAALRIGDG